MSTADGFLNEIRNQIDYTNKLEEAYIIKHTEIEILYDKLKKVIFYIQSNNSNNSNIPKLNEMIEEIQKIISTNSNFRQQQQQVLHDSKLVLEDLNNEPKVNKSVITPLINQIDSMFPDNDGLIVSGLKLNKSKKTGKKRKKSKKSKKK